jgi:hypothetical protein
LLDQTSTIIQHQQRVCPVPFFRNALHLLTPHGLAGFAAGGQTDIAETPQHLRDFIAFLPVCGPMSLYAILANPGFSARTNLPNCYVFKPPDTCSQILIRF